MDDVLEEATKFGDVTHIHVDDKSPVCHTSALKLYKAALYCAHVCWKLCLVDESQQEPVQFEAQLSPISTTNTWLLSIICFQNYCGYCSLNGGQ